MPIICDSSTLNALLDSKNPDGWNEWRYANFTQTVILQDIDFTKVLRRRKFTNFHFHDVTFKNCTFQGHQFFQCNFDGTLFSSCSLHPKSRFESCYMEQTKFSGSTLNGAVFRDCNLNQSEFVDDTKLHDVDFYGSSLIEATFKNSVIRKCKVYGANFWGLNVSDTVQEDIFITNFRSAKSKKLNEITKIYDIELAHLINLLTDNSKFSSIIRGVQSSFVLILGSFGDNLPNLQMLKDEILRHEEYVPILFDWNKEHNLDFLETIILLAGFSKFIVVDLSGPRSVPAELQAILSTIMIPVIPILKSDETEFGVYSFTNKYSWVSGVIRYDRMEDVTAKFDKAILKPALRMHQEITRIRKATITSKHINDI